MVEVIAALLKMPALAAAATRVGELEVAAAVTAMAQAVECCAAAEAWHGPLQAGMAARAGTTTRASVAATAACLKDGLLARAALGVLKRKIFSAVRARGVNT